MKVGALTFNHFATETRQAWTGNTHLDRHSPDSSATDEGALRDADLQSLLSSFDSRAREQASAIFFLCVLSWGYVLVQ